MVSQNSVLLRPVVIRSLCALAMAALMPASAYAQQTDADGSAEQAAPAPTAAQGPADANAAKVLTGPINLMITSQRRSARCGTSTGKGEIVVCGSDHGEDVRVPSTADSDPDSREGQDTGIPQAPNVSGLPDCRKHCIGMGSAPPRIYVIDLKSIPEAPKDSDAEKVARGEISDR
jgi:hypothetical protein